MASPIYFLPRVPLTELLVQSQQPWRLNRQVLAAHGLESLLGDVRDVQAECSFWELSTAAGPGGETGSMLTVLGIDEATRQPLDAPRLKYAAEWQSWHKVFQSDERSLWIGLDKEYPVTPGDLRRRFANHGGYRAELADGRDWLVPVVRRPDDSSNLPSDLYWNEAGRFTQQIKQQYLQIWQDTEQVCEWYLAGFRQLRENPGLVPEAMLLAIRLLGLHYRYDNRLHNLLRLVDSDTWAVVLGFAIDAPKLLDVQEAAKKNNPTSPPAAASSPPGPPADCPATAPVAAS